MNSMIPGSEPVFRVLIVDRDSMSSDLLANALVRNSRCEATTIAPTGLMRALAKAPVDLVVIAAEIQSESGGGFDLAHVVSRTHPNTGIVILLNIPTYDLVVNAFQSGALGVFSRQRPIVELFDCIERVRKGLIWAGKHETKYLLGALRSIPAVSMATDLDCCGLTARELQVARCAATGKTNKAIATELGLSEHTVKNYLFRAFEKLGVSSRMELLIHLTSSRAAANAATSPVKKGNEAAST